MKIKSKFKSIILFSIILLTFSYPWAFGDLSDQNGTELRLDKLFVEEHPGLANQIADKWFRRGDSKVASEFDKLYSEIKPQYAFTIVSKWIERGGAYNEIAYDFAMRVSMRDPYHSMTALKHWIKKGELSIGEEFANKILEIWISEDDEKVNTDLLWKLKLAAKINSEFYYEKLKSRDWSTEKSTKHEGTGPRMVRNYLKVLKIDMLKNSEDYLSMTDHLVNKVYIDPNLLKQNRRTKETIRGAIERGLYELSKKSDITFSILQVIALHAKEDPYFRVNILASDLTNDGNLGSYSELLDRVQIICNNFESSELLQRRLIHEWCHQAINILYNNESKPYRKGDNKAKYEYLQVIEGIKKIENKRELPGIKRFKDVFQLYDESLHESESIVRLPEIITLGYYENFEVQEALKPLEDYWMKYIKPDIEKYIRERAVIDDFICDCERENILKYFY